MDTTNDTSTTQNQIISKLFELSGQLSRIDERVVNMDRKLDEFSARQDVIENGLTELRADTDTDIQAVRHDIQSMKNAAATTDSAILSIKSTLDRVEADVSKIKSDRLVASVRLTTYAAVAMFLFGIGSLIYTQYFKPAFDAWIKIKIGM